MKRNIHVAVLLCLTIAQPACSLPRTYSADRIDARVIDAETEQPLEGVIVVAHWELRSTGYNPGGSVPIGQMMTMEAITDKKGKFHFPAWGPLIAWKGQMHDDDPQLIFFKSGYTRLILSNEDKFTLASVLRSHRTSDWNGKTIELKLFKGTGEEYAEHVQVLDANLEWARYGSMGTLSDCEWKKVPRMLVELHRLSVAFESQGIRLPGWRGGARIRKITDVGDERRCGSAANFFKDYLP